MRWQHWRVGISTEGFTSQYWDEFEHKDIDIAITVCDQAAGEVCPVYLNSAIRAHFSMAFLAWLFIRNCFAPFLLTDQTDSYIAGLILLAAAPCTAMVFMWSLLSMAIPCLP